MNNEADRCFPRKFSGTFTDGALVNVPCTTALELNPEGRWKDINLDSPLELKNRAPHQPVRTGNEACDDATPLSTTQRSPWTLQCHVHSAIKLAERRPHDSGTFVFHPICPMCLQDEIRRDSSDAGDHLDVLINHYDSIFQAYEGKSAPFRRLISELKDLKEDIVDVYAEIDLSVFDKRLRKALLAIESIVKVKPRSTKLTILEQIKSLSQDLTSSKEKLSNLSDNRSEQYQSNLVSVTNDILSQLVSLDLASRQEDIMECGDPASVLTEFEKLQTCMTDVTKALGTVSNLQREKSHKGGKNKRSPKSRKSAELKLRPRKCLDVIPECISLECSSHSSECSPIWGHFSSEISWQEPSDWDQSTLVSSSCSSTEGRMSVRNVVQRLKSSQGCNVGTLTLFECVDDWCRKNDVRSVEFAAAGGIPAVVQVMRAENYSLDIQTKACETLKYLARNESNLPLIVVVGGITAVLTAMSQYPRSVKLQTVALGALKYLSAHEDTRTEIIMDDGLDLILSAMQNHQGHSAVQRHAVAILETLEWVGIDPRAVSVLFACIRRHGRECHLQAHALSILRRILDTNIDDEKDARNAIEEVLSVLGAERGIEKSGVPEVSSGHSNRQVDVTEEKKKSGREAL